MKTYTPEELFIDIRRQEDQKRPKAGELIQGAVFALMNAQEYFESSTKLFSENMPTPAHGLFIHAIEEIGKISNYGDILISWQSPEKSDQFKSKQKNHILKISSALSMLTKIFNMKSVDISIKGEIETALGEEDLIPYIQKYLDPLLAADYHDLRMRMTYTHFDGQRVTSPKNNPSELTPEMFEAVSNIASLTLKKILETFDSKLPLYMGLIRECYNEKDTDKIRSLKQEINRRVERSFPAFRMYIDKLINDTTGYDIEDWMTLYKKELPEQLKNSDVLVKHILQLSDLIKSHQEIDLIYYYPPLKETAKEYYQSLASSASSKPK